MRLAQFKSVVHGYITYLESDQTNFRSDLVQVTEFAEVNFPPLATAHVVEKQLEVLVIAETELRTQFDQKLAQINGERAKLRALAHEVAS
jgi:hypothetical protein